MWIISRLLDLVNSLGRCYNGSFSNIKSRELAPHSHTVGTSQITQHVADPYGESHKSSVGISSSIGGSIAKILNAALRSHRHS